MKSFSRILLPLVIVIFSLSTHALAVESRMPSTTQFEIGTSLGAPGIGNVSMGIWHKPTSLVYRMSGSFWLYGGGIGSEVAWVFSESRNLRQYVGGGAAFGMVGAGFLAGGGGVYGLNWHGISLSGGLYAGVGGVVLPIFPVAQAGILPVAQLGYSWFLDM